MFFYRNYLVGATTLITVGNVIMEAMIIKNRLFLQSLFVDINKGSVDN